MCARSSEISGHHITDPKIDAEDGEFNSKITILGSLGAAMISPFYRYFAPAMVLLVAVLSFFGNGQPIDETYAKMGSNFDLASVKDKELDTIDLHIFTELAKVSLVMVFAYILSVFSKLIYGFPKNIKSLVKVSDGHIEVVNGWFIKNQSKIPIKQLVKVKVTNCWTSKFFGGRSVYLYSLSSGDKPVYIPFIENTQLDVFLNLIGFPVVPEKKIASRSVPACIIESLYTTKLIPLMSIVSMLAIYTYPKLADLFWLSYIMFFIWAYSLNLISNLSVFKYQTDRGFEAFGDHSFDRKIAIFQSLSESSIEKITSFNRIKSESHYVTDERISLVRFL